MHIGYQEVSSYPAVTAQNVHKKILQKILSNLPLHLTKLACTAFRPFKPTLQVNSTLGIA